MFPEVKIKQEKEEIEDVFVDCEAILEEKVDRANRSRSKTCCTLCGSYVNNYRRHILKVHFQVRNSSRSFNFGWESSNGLQCGPKAGFSSDFYRGSCINFH